MAVERVLFVRVGWMKRYKGLTADDEKPIGGGRYNRDQIGHENLNFLPFRNMVFGYFQPQMQPRARRKTHPSFVNLERIEQGFQGNKLAHVLIIFVATDPDNGGQRIVGWYRNATVHHHSQQCNAQERGGYIDYFAEAAEENAFLVPSMRRSFVVSRGEGGFGQTNIRYLLPSDTKTQWMLDAIAYVNEYKQENAAQQPESEADPEIAEIVSSTMERAAGFQSNPRIRRAIEEYAMKRAMKWLADNGLMPCDVHKNHPYDVRCTAAGADLYVEVKGTQNDGSSISLTPREVDHVRNHKNSALFIVHSVKVTGKRNPQASGGDQLFIEQWDISAGKLEPRGYVFTLPASTSATKKASSPDKQT